VMVVIGWKGVGSYCRFAQGVIVIAQSCPFTALGFYHDSELRYSLW
jgi:hypothetical protein